MMPRPMACGHSDTVPWSFPTKNQMSFGQNKEPDDMVSSSRDLLSLPWKKSEALGSFSTCSVTPNLL
jgi:hypothetical protein